MSLNPEARDSVYNSRGLDGLKVESMEELTSDEIIANLRLKAHYWRQEAATRFAGRPEEKWCLDYAQHAETLAELERLRKLD
jgi:hypothetical protein